MVYCILYTVHMIIYTVYAVHIIYCICCSHDILYMLFTWHTLYAFYMIYCKCCSHDILCMLFTWYTVYSVHTIYCICRSHDILYMLFTWYTVYAVHMIYCICCSHDTLYKLFTWYTVYAVILTISLILQLRERRAIFVCKLIRTIFPLRSVISRTVSQTPRNTSINIATFIYIYRITDTYWPKNNDIFMGIPIVAVIMWHAMIIIIPQITY